MSNNLVTNTEYKYKHTNPKNIKKLLKTAKNKRINKNIQENKTKRQSIITNNRISKKSLKSKSISKSKSKSISKSLKKSLKKSKSKENVRKKILDRRIRTARNKEYNKNRKPLDYLKMICSDTGVCIAFGIETKRIRRFFDEFENFNHVDYVHIKNGTTSVNGYIYEIKYELDNYVAYTILKTSKIITSDSLIYEYLVGTFINSKNMIYPCFLETYEIYKSHGGSKITSSTELKQLIPSSSLQTNNTKHIYETLIDLICSDNKSVFSLLIQHIKDAKKLHDCLKDNSLYEFEIYFILFQIYYTLSELSDNFTHYDLHHENILLYEPVNGSYIQYNYNVNGINIHFKSKYIVKIIDYGKCFFSNDKISSVNIRDYICNISNCDCGKNIGFNSITDNTGFCIQYHICSYKKNISHDLRLLHILNDFAVDIPILSNITEKVVYDSKYGTPELINSGLPTKINNIHDAFTLILETVQNPEIIEQNDIYYKNMILLGNLNVYGGNTKMTFTKAK
jgi:hypothetical protein